GFLLSTHAWQRAWRPPLRLAFEELARRQRLEAETEGRLLPEDDEAFIVATGVLRSDAGPTETGTSLSIDVDEPGAGGVVVTVLGTLASDRRDTWRAGR